MAKAFSVASWNVEHFQDKEGRNDKRIAFLREQQPDVLAIYEVEGKEVWRQLMQKLPSYSFFITEGRNTQEILVELDRGSRAF